MPLVKKKDLRRRLFWAVDEKTLRGFDRQEDRDGWVNAASFRNAIPGTDYRVRRAGKQWIIDGPCEIQLPPRRAGKEE